MGVPRGGVWVWLVLVSRSSVNDDRDTRRIDRVNVIGLASQLLSSSSDGLVMDSTSASTATFHVFNRLLFRTNRTLALV